MSWMGKIDWVDEEEDAKRIDDICALLGEEEEEEELSFGRAEEDELTEEEGHDRVTPQSAAFAVFQAFRSTAPPNRPAHVVPSLGNMQPVRPTQPPSVALQVSQVQLPQVMGYPPAPFAMAQTFVSATTRSPPRPPVVSATRPAQRRQGLTGARGARPRSGGARPRSGGARPRKEKWTEQENQALRQGVELFGTGKWFQIKQDPRFADVLQKRTNIDLKDRWRNFAGGRSKSARKLEKCGRSEDGARYRPY